MKINSKILMTAIAAGALLGATSLSNAQMSPSSAAKNEAAAQKHQDDSINAQSVQGTTAVKPTPLAATASKPARKQAIRATPDSKQQAGPSGPGSSTSGTVGSSGSEAGAANSGATK